MLQSAFSLSPTHLSWGSKVGWCTASAGAQHKPLLCSQMSPGDVLLPKPLGAQPGVSMLARGQ